MYVLQAEEMASKFVQTSVPRDLDVRISLPVSRLLAQVRLSLAELRLSQAKQRGIHAVDDRDKERPRFPKVLRRGLLQGCAFVAVTVTHK